MTELARATLQEAKLHLGEHETGGPNHGPFVAKVLMLAGLAQGQPWCAAFATACAFWAAKKLGVTLKLPRTASTSAIARWARDTGNLLEDPEPGCLVLVKGNAYGTGYVHTCLCHDVEAHGMLLTIEGNWKDRVMWNRRKAEGCDFVRIA